jgi:hypothetical protein
MPITPIEESSGLGPINDADYLSQVRAALKGRRALFALASCSQREAGLRAASCNGHLSI